MRAKALDEFRIVESFNGFQVERKTIVTKGLWFWQKHEEHWESLGINGRIISWIPDRLPWPALARFATIREARRFIQKMRKPVRIHKA